GDDDLTGGGAPLAGDGDADLARCAVDGAQGGDRGLRRGADRGLVRSVQVDGEGHAAGLGHVAGRVGGPVEHLVVAVVTEGDAVLLVGAEVRPGATTVDGVLHRLDGAVVLRLDREADRLVVHAAHTRGGG